MAAYKGLLKEKEALEASLAIVSSSKSETPVPLPDTAIPSTSSVPSNDENHVDNNASSEMQLQIATVMQSLATLSAEKSKMEASFQADKRALRLELQQKDKQIVDLQEKLRGTHTQNKLEVEKTKSKLIIERHEWEKESNNQMLMIRELQKLLSDERHLKENLEMQLNDLKMQFTQTDTESRVKELVTELEQTRRKLKEVQNARVRDSGSSATAENILKQLQSEMTHLKKQHAAAIHSEQQRAQRAEERNKKLAAVHEDRVANLENRLAELSTTVGTYDRLRQLDQENIHKLKEKIAQLTTSSENELIATAAPSTTHSITTKYDSWNMNELISEILQLKNVLLLENSKLENPMDISKIYGVISGSNQNGNEHADCLERYELLLTESQDNHRENEKLRESVEVLKTHIKTLQSKVEVLNRNIDEQELELRNKLQEFKDNLRQERTKWKEMSSNIEIEYRTKLSELELQLQKQRERSLNLLEEKENEIKSLKSSYDVFPVPRSIKSTSVNQSTDVEDHGDEKPRRSKKVSTSSLIGSVISEGSIETDDGNGPSGTAVSKDSIHMLHYVHELSRKEVEISSLRKAKHMAESTLRQALQDKATVQEALYDKISFLEEQVDRLERCKSREGANLEYLKNVVLSFLASNDIDGKRHMVNAIGAVLKFSPSEIKTINSYFAK